MMRTPQAAQLRNQARERHMAERRALRTIVIEAVVTLVLLAAAIGLWGFG